MGSGPIDLTMTVSEDLPAFPGSPSPHVIPWETIADDGYNLELVFMSTHTGTHIDAPRHFVRRGATVDRIPPSRLVCEAVVLGLAGRDASMPITWSDVAAAAPQSGLPAPGEALVIRTGWSDRTERDSYFGRCPGLSADAARRIASLRPALVGIDSPSIDAGNASSFPAHKALLGAGIPVVENLTGLMKIRTERFRLAVLPLKLGGGTGAPARALCLGEVEPPPPGGAEPGRRKGLWYKDGGASRPRRRAGGGSRRGLWHKEPGR